MTQVQVRGSANRSLFWPLLLVGIGVVWLLTNLNVFSIQNVAVALRLWPLLLIVAGVELLYGRRSPRLGLLIALGTVALFVVLMLVGPALGLGVDLQESTLNGSEPAADVTSARVILRATSGQVNVRALADSGNLIDFDLVALGKVDYRVSGETDKIIQLEQQDRDFAGLAGIVSALLENDANKYHWNVNLSPDVPLELEVANGTGSVNLDLRDLKPAKVNVSVGTGGVDLNLPALADHYDVTVDAGTGGGTVIVEEGANVALKLGSGTGGFTIDVPEGAAVRLDASTGVGGISVPSNFRRMSGSNDDKFVGDSGVWETTGYANAERRITINFSGGTGGLTVR